MAVSIQNSSNPVGTFEEEVSAEETSTSSQSEEEDEELLKIQEQIEKAEREKAEREEKLRIQKEQLAKIQKKVEDNEGKGTAKKLQRAKSAEKKQKMLKHLKELNDSNDHIKKQEYETLQATRQMEELTLGSKNGKSEQKTNKHTNAELKVRRLKKLEKSSTEDSEEDLTMGQEELTTGREHRRSRNKKHKKPTNSQATLRQLKKPLEMSSTEESGSDDSDESDQSVQENLKRLLKAEKLKAKQVSEKKKRNQSLVQKKVEELERLQLANQKEESKLKKSVMATKEIEEEIEAEKKTQQQNILASMAKAEEEQKKRLRQQKKKEIERLEMEQKLKDLKRENKDRLEETIRTASETKLLEESISSEILDAEKYKLRRKEISQLMRLIKKAQVVDLCFLVDATGSMGSYINEVKNSIKNLVKELSAKHESLKLNLAFVAYRDHCDAGKSYGQYQILDFITCVEDFQAFVGSVIADGGGDGPEDIFGGFQKVLALSWTAPTTRVVMHIADAPCHGSRFHTMHDDYPSGDPHGLTAEDLLVRLQRDSNIYTFMFFKLNDHTDKMIAEFHSILGPNSEWLKVYPLRSMNVLMEAVSHTISASISTVESSTMSSFLTGTAGATCKKVFSLDPKVPDWSMIPSKPYHCHHHHSYVLPPIATVTEAEISACITKSFDLESHEGSIQVAPNPFAKGALRVAYHAMNQKQSGTMSSKGCPRSPEPCVVKDYIEMKVRENAFKKHLAELETQAVASFLANSFNKVKPSGSKEMIFLETEVLKLDEPGVCLSKEPWIPGDYKKFNNNWGWVDEEDYSASVQAFSHWTYQISNQYLIVVDLQGKKNHSTFLLTDPVIHCKDLIRFGRTNLGPTGVSKFFKSHACNQVCKALLLKPQADQPLGKVAPKSSTVLC